MTSQPVRLDCDCPEGESGYTRSRFRDFTTHLGGPILQDRLWFFGGIYFVDREAQPKWTLGRFDFATGEVSPVTVIEHLLLPFWVSVSPDERWILYTRLEGIRHHARREFSLTWTMAFQRPSA